jgi:fused signal recognition particle receptor
VVTAGRLHTKTILLEELNKMMRIMAREIPVAPHEILLALDATNGQNAIAQAKMFKDAIGITGIVLTKLDGTSKGGVIIRISNELNIPLRYIGVGEGLDDLRPFDSEEFIDALFEKNSRR